MGTQKRTGTKVTQSCSLALALTVTCVATLAALPQEQHRHKASLDGSVHFVTSCSPSVAEDFDRAVARLHSFWFSAALGWFVLTRAREQEFSYVALSRELQLPRVLERRNRAGVPKESVP